jgi:PIN domain nuclease of toxin-antitoxin system
MPWFGRSTVPRGCPAPPHLRSAELGRVGEWLCRQSRYGKLPPCSPKGRVRAYGTLEASIQIFLEEVAVRPITPEICALGAMFPDDYSHDPADRIIGGTARAEGLTLVTHDERIRRSPLIKTVW